MIPLKQRKQIKAYLEKYFGPIYICSLPKVFRDHLMEKLPTIFFFGVIDWDFRFQRPQHLAMNLAKLGYRVIYINPTFCPKNRMAGGNYYLRGVFNDTIPIVELAADRNVFIYSEKPNAINKEVIIESLRALIKMINFQGNPIMIFDHPFWNFISSAEEFRDFKKIYDCMDLHTHFSVSTKDMSVWEKRIVADCDEVITSSGGITEHIRAYDQTKKVTQISNACDFDSLTHIKTNSTPMGVGYVGEIGEWFDSNLIEYCITHLPDTMFTFYGECRNSKVKALARNCRNLLLAGEIKYQDVAEVISNSKVMVIPFALNTLTQAVDPVKLYEYLAFGKPVVTSNMKEVKKAKELIYISETKEEFLDNLKTALSEDDNIQRNRRIHFAERNTWRSRGHDIKRIIDKLI